MFRGSWKKAKQKKGLSPEEAAVLLAVDGQELKMELFETASRIKNEIYGERLVFLPRFISATIALMTAPTAISIVLMLGSPAKNLTLRRLSARRGS